MSSRKWYIRRSDGKVLDFADLGALRGAIDAGLVDITDDVSRNGEEWSTLTSIAEFQSLFHYRSNPSKVPVVEAFSQAAKPFDEPDFDAGLNHITGQMATIRGQRPTQFKNRNAVRTALLSLLALGFGAIAAWGIQTMMDNQERDAAAAELLSEAQTLADSDDELDLEKALSKLDEVKLLERNDFASATLRGNIYFQQAKTLDRRREDGRRTLSEEGVNGDPQRLKLEAELAALSKDIETKVASAFVAFQDVIELDAEHVGSRTGMLLLAMFRGQRPEVNEHLSVLRTLTPDESLLDFAEGWSLLESAPDKAYAFVKKAHESGYQTLDSERLLAQLLIELRQWAQFKVWLKAQQTKKGLPAWELERLANIAAQLEKAEAVLASADAKPQTDATVSKETDDALLKRAALLRRRDKPKSASRIYKRVIERSSRPPVEAYTGLGWCLFDLNLPYESQKEFRRAIQISPKAADAHLGLAEVLRSLDDSSALSHFEIYLKLRPRADDADYVKRVVEQLR